MNESATSSTGFSWKLSIQHTLATAVPFLAASLLEALIFHTTAAKAGEIWGGFLIPSLLCGWLWSLAKQGKRPWKNIVVFILAVLFLFQVAKLAALAMHGDMTLTSDDRMPPTRSRRGADTVLCQGSLGFWVRPGTTVLASDINLQSKVTEANETPDTLALWAYRAEGGVVVISGSRGFTSKDSLNRMVQGFLRSAQSQGFTNVTHRVDWFGRDGVILMGGTAGNVGMATRCVSAPSGELGCVQTIAAEDRFQDLRNSLTIGDCP